MEQDKTMSPLRRKHIRGFTLAEALVTLALAAIVLPVATRGILMASEAARVSRERMEAVTLAETQLQEIILSAEWTNGLRNGDFGEEWPEYRWSLDVDLWERDGFRLLTVTVEWNRSGRDFDIAVSELVREASG